jgi:hypothetical protein
MNIFLKNPLLAWLGTAMLFLFFAELILFFYDKRELTGVNIWLKPMKFSLATWIFTWTIAYILSFIENPTKVSIINWIVFTAMMIEIILIVYQAFRGEKSHFNMSSPANAAIFSMMGFVITINTIAIVVLTFWFFTDSFQLELPLLWAIRLGLIMFVIFSFEGFVMGSMLKHSVGVADGGKGIFFLNWNISAGDLRVAHFIGIHALQALPLFALLLLNFKHNMDETVALALVFIFAFCYFSISSIAFTRAMMGKPLLFG